MNPETRRMHIDSVPAHLLDIESTPPAVLKHILALAAEIRERPAAFAGAAEGRLLINLFYEPSTRTRVSFEVAALRLGLRVVNVAAADSSVKKGETLMDTFRTLQAMAPDVLVVRHPEDGALTPLAEAAAPGLHLVNAGDGARSHPTQALLDLVTLQQHAGPLENLTVLVAGDLHHSRVTRSGAALMKALGVGELRLCAPPGLEAGPRVTEGARCFDSLDEALVGADVVMMLRIQRERLAGMAIPDPESYHRRWGLTEERLALASPGCLVMHPGPMNRGVEIASSVADGPRSLILDQVENGVYTRMAVIHTLLHGAG
ncbi:MAG: aspartate carbamoyltransferase catalytic subunit [Xanthomonadales bacterium]|jgi:aspartate carbamoyltransferase catalytic subunit|nr:aspartate carbamoyltransferase catalytic subunit [Xanthomonadales bacterium]